MGTYGGRQLHNGYFLVRREEILGFLALTFGRIYATGIL